MDDFNLGKAIQALEWEANYRKKAEANHFLVPLYFLDKDFEKYLNLLNITKGKVLDIGTGSGEQAIYLAKRGFDVTATDVSSSAIKDAKKLLSHQNIEVNFLVDNILSTGLSEGFNLIVDRGCYTLIPEKYKSVYISTIKKLLNPRGWVFLKVDKKKSECLQLFKNGKFFKEYATELSQYATSKDEIPAVVLILQKN